MLDAHLQKESGEAADAIKAGKDLLERYCALRSRLRNRLHEDVGAKEIHRYIPKRPRTQKKSPT